MCYMHFIWLITIDENNVYLMTNRIRFNICRNKNTFKLKINRFNNNNNKNIYEVVLINKS